MANVDKKSWTQEDTEDTAQVDVNVTFRKEDFKCFLEDNIFEQLQISVTFKETTNQTVFAKECQIDESRPSNTTNDFTNATFVNNGSFFKRTKRSTKSHTNHEEVLNENIVNTPSESTEQYKHTKNIFPSNDGDTNQNKDIKLLQKEVYLQRWREFELDIEVFNPESGESYNSIINYNTSRKIHIRNC